MSSERVNPPGVEAGAHPIVRVAHRAVIIRDGALLVNVNTHHPVGGQLERWYTLPGGGQEWGEDAAEALRRECREELGCEIEVGELIAARDYIGARHQYAATDAWFHQFECFYECHLAEGAVPDPVGHADAHQVGTLWLPLADVPTAPLAPEVLRTWLLEDPVTRRRHLGSVD